MKSYFTKKEQIVILIVVSIILSIVGFKFLSYKLISKEKSSDYISLREDNNLDEDLLEEDEKDPIGEDENHQVELAEEDIVVHISGQVKNPGIVNLKLGKRLIDAIEILGGLTSDADQDRINLAKKLQDEEKIYIPKIGEDIDLPLMSQETSKNETVLSEEANDKEKIDINVCTKEELISLPGIGEVIAGRIIDFREENIFKTIEDIKNVSGIGDKKYEGLKDLIIVK